MVAETFRNISLGLAVFSAALYWAAFIDNARVTAERGTALSAATLPIPLNGFQLHVSGVAPMLGSVGRAAAVDRGKPQLLMVVRDSCPGCGVIVPQWLDWIRSSPSNDYSAAVVSIEGTKYPSQISDALASRGVETLMFRVTQLAEFTFSSGVSVTPTLLAVDRDGRVRFASGTFSAQTRRSLNDFLQNQSLH